MNEGLNRVLIPSAQPQGDLDYGRFSDWTQYCVAFTVKFCWFKDWVWESYYTWHCK